MVDAHQHFWKYNAVEYPWISYQMTALRRDFLPAELESLMQTSGVEKAVAVQACQTVDETRWLLRMAQDHPFIAGVVGWAPIASPDFHTHLESLRAFPKLKGLRHMLQDEPDDRYMLRKDFQSGIAALQANNLVYDILIYSRQLPFATQLADRNPHQIFVLDHLAKPKIRVGEISPWREDIRELARRPNVFCKLSGMVTEADWNHWSIEDLQPYLEIVIESFGPERLLAGSDWPVCTLASEYAGWWQTLRALISGLSHSEQQAILGANAIKVYSLR